ncbi:MAG: multicopper oxidase domain-containing protein, partial [Burkholderiales bacterium]|nr:multicopper oxidase domain-containing protein [Burkholderiales bacterium]
MAATALASLLAGGAALADPADKLEHIKPVLVAPPHVMEHEQATKAKPRVVEFTMTIEEKKIVIDEENGTTMQAMTFNGSMPGPTMVVHEGDYVQLTLINPTSNALEHN